MDYELYHDESLEGGYWHGMLLVPMWNKKEFLDLLTLARTNTRYFDKIGIKKVERRGYIYDCASAWAQIGIACLRSTTNGKAEPIFLGEKEKGKLKYGQVNLYGMKFILFRERDSHKELEGFTDHASKIETTFRFGIKGGLHALGSNENPINITRIHFDGHEHYQRNVDRDRIVKRLNGLRSYCSFSSRTDLVDDRHSNHKRAGSQDEDDCQFLQLTDILIGCFRTSLGYKTRNIHMELAQPIRNLVNKYNEGSARMKNSRWANSFVVSQCYLENSKWKFEAIEQNNKKETQGKLFQE
jgi:hypothetical protein